MELDLHAPIRHHRMVFEQFYQKMNMRDHLEEQGVDGRMVSECILGRLAEGV
jgi:hypothetical protein